MCHSWQRLIEFCRVLLLLDICLIAVVLKTSSGALSTMYNTQLNVSDNPKYATELAEGAYIDICPCTFISNKTQISHPENRFSPKHNIQGLSSALA